MAGEDNLDIDKLSPTLPKELLKTTRVALEQLLGKDGVLQRMENSSVVAEDGTIHHGLNDSSLPIWTLALQNERKVNEYREGVLNEAKKLRDACETERVNAIANSSLQDAHKSLARFVNWKPQEIKDQAFATFKKFVVNNPQYIPELQDALGPIDAASKAAVEAALDAVKEALEENKKLESSYMRMKISRNLCIDDAMDHRCLAEVLQTKLKELRAERARCRHLVSDFPALEDEKQDHIQMIEKLQQKNKMLEEIVIHNERKFTMYRVALAEQRKKNIELQQHNKVHNVPSPERKTTEQAEVIRRLQEEKQALEWKVIQSERKVESYRVARTKQRKEPLELQQRDSVHDFPSLERRNAGQAGTIHKLQKEKQIMEREVIDIERKVETCRVARAEQHKVIFELQQQNRTLMDDSTVMQAESNACQNLLKHEQEQELSVEAEVADVAIELRLDQSHNVLQHVLDIAKDIPRLTDDVDYWRNCVGNYDRLKLAALNVVRQWKAFQGNKPLELRYTYGDLASAKSERSEVLDELALVQTQSEANEKSIILLREYFAKGVMRGIQPPIFERLGPFALKLQEYSRLLSNSGSSGLRCDVVNHTRIAGLVAESDSHDGLFEIGLRMLESLGSEHVTITMESIQRIACHMEKGNEGMVSFGLAVVYQVFDLCARHIASRNSVARSVQLVTLFCTEIILSHVTASQIILRLNKVVSQLRTSCTREEWLVYCMLEILWHRLRGLDTPLRTILFNRRSAVSLDGLQIVPDGSNLIICKGSGELGFVRMRQIRIDPEWTSGFRILFEEAPLIGTKAIVLDKLLVFDKLPCLLHDNPASHNERDLIVELESAS